MLSAGQQLLVKGEQKNVTVLFLILNQALFVIDLVLSFLKVLTATCLNP